MVIEWSDFDDEGKRIPRVTLSDGSHVEIRRLSDNSFEELHIQYEESALQAKNIEDAKAEVIAKYGLE